MQYILPPYEYPRVDLPLLQRTCLAQSYQNTSYHTESTEKKTDMYQAYYPIKKHQQ